MNVDPRVSVIIPTFRRPRLLARCLASLVDQELPLTDYEIIVCDDGPNQRTAAVADRFSKLCRIRYVPVTMTRGPAAARNAGAAAANGKILAFIDDDCIADWQWLSRGLAEFDNAGVSAVTGKVIVPCRFPLTDYQRNESGLSMAEFVTANLLLRKCVFNELGGFDASFTMAWREDSDLHFRLIERGRKIVHAETAVVRHPVRAACWGISVLQQRKCMFDALLFKKHPELYRIKISSLPPLIYYGAVFSMVAALFFLLSARPLPAVYAFAAWLVFTGCFLAKRLSHTSKTPGHVAEMLVTSIAIPFLSTFYRLYGGYRFRVLFF